MHALGTGPTPINGFPVIGGTGTVRYHRVPAFLIGGPVAVRIRPGTVQIMVDEAQTAPEFPMVSDLLTQVFLDGWIMRDEPDALPALNVQIHRVKDLPGSQAMTTEVVGHVLHVEVIRELATETITRIISQTGTQTMHWFARRR